MIYKSKKSYFKGDIKKIGAAEWTTRAMPSGGIIGSALQNREDIGKIANMQNEKWIKFNS